MARQIRFRKIEDDRNLTRYSEWTERYLDVKYPQDYLRRSHVMAIVSENPFGEIDKILGGYIIASKPPFRVLEQLPRQVIEANAELAGRMGRCLELTGLWIHPQLRCGRLRFQLWWRLFMDTLRECLHGRHFLLYSYDASKKKLGEMYQFSKPSRIYEGRVFIPGMTEANDEIVEIGSALSVVFAFVRHPVRIAQFITARLFRRRRHQRRLAA